MLPSQLHTREIRLNTHIADYIADTIDNQIEMLDDQARMLAEQTEGGRDAKVAALTRLADRFNESLLYAKRYCSADRRAHVCNICEIEIEELIGFVADYVDLDS